VIEKTPKWKATLLLLKKYKDDKEGFKKAYKEKYPSEPVVYSDPKDMEKCLTEELSNQ